MTIFIQNIVNFHTTTKFSFHNVIYIFLETYHQDIIYSLATLRNVIEWRLKIFFNAETEPPVYFDQANWAVQVGPQNSIFTKFNLEEYIIFMLALAPHVQPNFIDQIIQQHLPNGGDFPEMGGVKGTNHRCMIPTGETALFILAGNDLEKRREMMKYFSPEHFFYKESLLYLENVKEGEPAMSGKIILQPEYIDLFILGTVSKPTFSPEFPAKLITTKMEWEDLVLNEKTARQIEDIKIWLHYNSIFMQDW
jgi:hypothetical protein